MMNASMLLRSPWIKKERNLGPKHLRLGILWPHGSSDTKANSALKKQQNKKNKEEAADYTQVLAKRTKEA